MTQTKVWDGSQWIALPPGPVGPQGPQGAVGPQGTPGVSGANAAVNLLTVNQSSVETDLTGLNIGAVGAAAYANTSLSRSTAQAASGSASLLATAVAAGACQVTTGVFSPAATVTANVTKVRPGVLHTASVVARGVTGSVSFVLRAACWDASGAWIGYLSTPNVTTTATTTAWTPQVSFPFVTPTNAAYAAVVVEWTAAAPGEGMYLDKIGLWEGYGGTWSLGGQPIQGVGERWDETVGRRCFQWDWNNSREQMVYGDTGWRDVTPENGWTATTMRIRRVGMTVEFSATVVNGSASSTTTAYTIPSGFQPVAIVQIPVGYTSSAIADAPLTNIITALTAGGTRTSFTSSRWSMTWTTTNAWPSSLPGTASGTIPA